MLFRLVVGAGAGRVGLAGGCDVLPLPVIMAEAALCRLGRRLSLEMTCSGGDLKVVPMPGPGRQACMLVVPAGSAGLSGAAPDSDSCMTLHAGGPGRLVSSGPKSWLPSLILQ